MIQWILILIITYLIYKYVLLTPFQYWKNLGIPFVKPKFLVGNSWSIVTKKKSFANWTQDLYNSFDDVRYIGIYQFSMPGLLLKDLDLIKQICVKDFDHFNARKLLVSEDAEPMLSKNLIGLKGQKWKQMRATLSPTFTGNKMRHMFILMQKCSEQFVAYLNEKVKPDKPLEVEMKGLFGRFATDIIASTVFGISCDSIHDENNEFYEFSKKATYLSGLSVMLKAMGYMYFNYFMKLFNIKIFPDDVCNFYKNIVINNIKEREEKGIIRPDMIHLLMEAKKGKLKYEDKTKEDDTGFATVEESQIGNDNKLPVLELTDDDILSQAFVFFLAGFDGVSTVMSHMAFELAINQDIQKKLQEEIDETLEECQGNITYEKLMRMQYMDMVFCENMRKWPGPAVDRVCTIPYKIEAQNPDEITFTLKQEDTVLIPIFAIHRDPKYYPDPEKFDPERFSNENKQKIIPFSYLPFGTGPRNCIGSRYAIMEIKLIMFNVLSNFNFILSEKSVVPLQLATDTFTTNAKGGFWLAIERRNK